MDIALWELLGYPLLLGGFAALHLGWARGAQAWIASTPLAFAAVWLLSAEGSGNRARIADFAGAAGWAAAIAAPVLAYALLIRWARRKAREREG